MHKIRGKAYWRDKKAAGKEGALKVPASPAAAESYETNVKTSSGR
jgi:hypothetical protein